MRASFAIVVAVVLVASVVLSPAAGQAVSPDHLLISEVLYDPAAPEPGAEWIEVHAPAGVTVSLGGWRVRDNSAEDALPDVQIGPGEYVVIAADESAFRQAYPSFTGRLLNLGSPIGNGLANGGDRVLLVDPGGATVDAMSYGSDPSVFNPPCPDVPEGEALARVPPDADGDSAGDWSAQAMPTPGGPPAPPTEPTLTPAVTFTPTLLPTFTATPTRAATFTPTLLLTFTATPTPAATFTPTLLPTFTATPTPAATFTPTFPPTFTATPAPAATGTATPTAAAWPTILLTEVMYDPLQEGTDSDWEWIEIRSLSATSVRLGGWQIADSNSRDVLPDVELLPGAYLVVAAGEAAFRISYPDFTGALVSFDGPIGNGLSNAGDSVRLLAPDGTTVDAMSYGTDASAFAPACRDVPAGESLARVPDTTDSDTAADWAQQSIPNPGAPGNAPTPTPTATPSRTATLTRTATATRTPTPVPSATATRTRTASPTRTATPTRIASPTPTWTGGTTPTPTWTATRVVYGKLLITEVMYDAAIEGAESGYEWIEVYARGPDGIDLAGWRVEDNTNGDTLPAAVIPPGGYLVIAATRDGFLAQHPGYTGALVSLEGSIGNGLSNSGDRVRLLAPDGVLADAMSYGTDRSGFDPACPPVGAGESLARVPSDRDTDSAADWQRQAAPNPGGPGIVLTPTASPTASATLEWTATPTPSVTSSRTPTGTATASPTARPYDRDAIRLNEILPAPAAVDWDGSGEADSHDEYVELRNMTAQTVSLAGWTLDDRADGGSRPYVLPTGAAIGPHGYLVVFQRDSGVILNNDTDAVRLLGPDGATLDTYSYTSPKPDQSFSRTGTGEWTDTYAPSPNAENRPPDATPTPTATPTTTPIPEGVRLNELLPNPQTVDWDADGETSWRDEWVELYNASEKPAPLGGWRMVDASSAYTIPAGTVIWPRSYLLLFRQQTGLALSDWRDTLTLLRPDGLTADQFGYEGGVSADRSLCRAVDGSGPWTRDCEVTPGRANRLLPPAPTGAPGAPGAKPVAATPVPQTVAAARAAREDTRVVITGTVTLPPGLIAQTIYLQDATGGIKVYLRKGEYPALDEGDRVRVSGWTRDFYGEREISVPDAGYLGVLGQGKPVAAKPITSAGMIEANEGQLVQIAGAVIKYETRALVLKDRNGLIRVYFPESLPWRRPYVQLGQLWAAQGVLGQYVGAQNTDAGYRIVPRFRSDVVRGPGVLPVTGGALTPQYPTQIVR